MKSEERFMNSSIKRALPDVAPSPDHNRKDQFIKAYRRKYARTQISMVDIIKSQFGYIRMPVWLISIAALIVAIWGIQEDREVLFAVSAIMPFVSGIAIFDFLRSGMYGMTELESVTLVSKRGILFSRFICVGIAHIILLAVLAVIVGKQSGYGCLLTGAMLTIPYLISSIASMELERTDFGRKNVMGCIVVSVIVSGIIIVLHNEHELFSEKYQAVWYLAAMVLIIMECIEIRKTFRWEEYAWN